MPFGISIWELMILLVVLLLVFGAKRLPEMGKSLGKGMREFKDAVTGMDEAVTTTAAAAAHSGSARRAHVRSCPPLQPGARESDEAEAEETARETVR